MAAQKTREPQGVLERKSPPRSPVKTKHEIDQSAWAVEQAWQRYALHLLRSQAATTPLVIGVTSTIRGEGRTSSSVALAISLASETQEPVALLGLDCSGYGFAEAFGMPEAPDLEGVLRGAWSPEAALTESGVPGLAVLPARTGYGRDPLAPAAYWPVLRRGLPGVISQLRKSFAYIVCDLPPLLDNADAPELVREMDSVILLTRTGVTPMGKLEEALSLVDRDRLLGAVHIGGLETVPRWISALLLE